VPAASKAFGLVSHALALQITPLNAKGSTVLEKAAAKRLYAGT
jgi:hypothetical protein